jgi:flagellar biosynthesis GTPase FlhF
LRRRELSGATLDKAGKTLRVASVDPELQPLLERGTLHEDLTAAGFGLDPGIVPAGRKRESAARATPDRAEQTRKKEKARERLQAARAALTEAKRAARKAEAELQDATQRSESAQQDVERATKEMERAQESAADA